MKKSTFSRREALAQMGLLASAALAIPQLSATAAAAPAPQTGSPFRFSLNSATIRGQKLGIVREIEVAAKAGYDGIEPWLDSLNEYVKNGGDLKDLRKRIADAGLVVEGGVGFPEWVVDDDARRAKGLEQAKREMDIIAQIGGKRFAAPPAGATNLPKLDLTKAAERYRVLLEAGEQVGVVPQLEMWGGSKNLNRLSDCAWVALETGHPNACVLADVFHMYKGGSDFNGLRLLSANAIRVFHLNDYPAEPPREKIDDSFRLFPGDGTAPWSEILGALRGKGGQVTLSLELFNRKLWAEEPQKVAETGLAKMKAVAARASG